MGDGLGGLPEQSGRCPRSEISPGPDWGPCDTERVGYPPPLHALDRRRTSTHTLGCGSAVPFKDRCEFPGLTPSFLLSRFFWCLSCPPRRRRLTSPIPRELRQGGVQPTAPSVMNSPVWAPELCLTRMPWGQFSCCLYSVHPKRWDVLFMEQQRHLGEREGHRQQSLPMNLTRKKKKNPTSPVFFPFPKPREL